MLSSRSRAMPSSASECPLHAEPEHDPPFYVLSRFQDVVDVLKKPTLWNNGDGPGVFYQETGVLGSADDPDHARHRRILRSAFLPSAIARLEPRVAAIADELFDEIVPRGEGDFVELYAVPVPGDRHQRAARRPSRRNATTSVTGA